MSSQVQITPISTGMRIGEGPFWMGKQKALVYVDLLNGNLYRYFQETKRTQKLHVEDLGTGGTASFIVPVEGHDDEFVVGVGRTLSAMKWSPNDPDDIVRKPRPIVAIENNSTTRFNDAKCDPEGRLYAGTMSTQYDVKENVPKLPEGSLYRFHADLKPKRMCQNISISNGLAWSKDRRTFYYNDSMEIRVDAFDYDITTGDIANRRTVIDYAASKIKGLPDGMDIDINGNLWVACYGASQVIRVDPQVGKVVEIVKFPSAQTTSCCWGGNDYSTLFVTSGHKNMTAEEIKAAPHSGKTFSVTGLGTKGEPANEFKVISSMFPK